MCSDTTSASRRKLTYYADILKYYRALAAASPRVKVISIGKSNEGRELVVVFIGADESIKNLETYRGYLSQLAEPPHDQRHPGQGDRRQGQADLPPSPADSTAARWDHPRC